MEKFTLTKELETTVQTVDFQHSILIDFINELTASFDTRDNEKILVSLHKLARFTKQHFMYEEMIFTNFNYQKRNGHCKRHQSLLKDISELVTQLEDNQQIDYNEVYSFLKQWLTNHIQVEDKAYVSFMKEKNVP